MFHRGRDDILLTALQQLHLMSVNVLSINSEIKYKNRYLKLTLEFFNNGCSALEITCLQA